MSDATRALAVFGVGVALMLVLDSTWTRVVGVACLMAGIVLGVFALATPDFIEEDPDG